MTPLTPAPAPVVPAFDRNARLFGPAGVARLCSSHALILGMGGVGSYVVEAVARAGVGRLTLVDFDDICITNVNRQLHATPATVGARKAEAMAERVRAIHPAARVESMPVFYEARTARSVFAGRPDVVIDCIDNVTAKLHLLATCIYRSIPVVTSLGASGKVDPTQVRWTDLRKTHDDPLGKAIRKNLWRVYGINLQRVSHLAAVFSDEPVILPDPAYRGTLCGVDCVCPSANNQHHTCARRHVIYGSAVFVTSVFGMTAASLAVRYLTGDRRVELRPTVKVLPGDDPLRDPDECREEIGDDATEPAETGA